MDKFLREIYVLIYKKWITFQTSDSYQIIEEENEVILDSLATKATISFHEKSLIELSVINKKNDKVEFYLHFQMQTLKHAIGLFNELVDTLLHINEHKTLNVLLSCSSGLTTGFFADELNKGAETLSLDYHFNAVSYNELPNVGMNYDLVLLAPQISYQLARVQSILNRTPVEMIPSQAFAKYDVGAIFKLIEECFTDTKVEDNLDLPQVLKLTIDYSEKILAIGILKSARHTHIHYRVYEKSHILYNGHIIKRTMCMGDVDDIINLCLSLYSDIKEVAIAAPGIISNGHLTLPSINFDHIDVIGYLKRKHPSLHFSLDNDVNAIAVGIYALQDKYDSLSFTFLPHGHHNGGIGNVFRGQLLKGYQNVAGEIKYLPLQFSDDVEKLCLCEEGCTEIIAKYLVSSIVMNGPDFLTYYCANVPSVDDLKEKMKEYIPEEYIPEIKKIDNLIEYILFGEMIMIIMRIENKAMY